MPNATVRAIAEAMPVDRRAALGSLASAVAMFGISGLARAAQDHPDAELFALARRAKELSAASRRAFDAADALERSFEPLPIPQALIATAQDARDFGPLMATVGEPFRPGDIETICTFRDLFLAVGRVAVSNGSRSGLGTPNAVVRASEIELVGNAYYERKRAAREAFGIPAADARAEAIQGDELRAFHALAFTPARTVEGVLAKLAAVAPSCQAGNPSQHSDSCDEAKVLEMAARDLAALRAEA